MSVHFLANCYPNLEKNLLNEIETHSITKKFSAGEMIVHQGQSIIYLPIIVSGNVKVFSQEDSIQFLLYYISTGGSCIFSFAHVFKDTSAEFSAIAESNSELLLLPIDQANQWLHRYPSFINLVLQDYQKHYTDLLNTTKQIVCYNLEERLIKYLNNKTLMEDSDILSISHQEIADDLGTSREVITRLMKKLSKNHQVKQMGRRIQVL